MYAVFFYQSVYGMDKLCALNLHNPVFFGTLIREPSGRLIKETFEPLIKAHFGSLIKAPFGSLTAEKLFDCVKLTFLTAGKRIVEANANV